MPKQLIKHRKYLVQYHIRTCLKYWINFYICFKKEDFNRDKDYNWTIKDSRWSRNVILN